MKNVLGDPKNWYKSLVYNNLQFYPYTHMLTNVYLTPPSPPKYVGRWQIGENFSISQTRRPRWLTRVMTKFLLQWEWVDNPTP